MFSMKKSLAIIFTAIMASFVVTSCFKDDPDNYDYPSYYSFATVSMSAEGEPAIQKCSFVTDDSKVLNPAQSAISLVKLRDQQRVVVYFSFLDESSYPEASEYDIKIYQIDTTIVTAPFAKAANEEERRKIGDNSFSVNISPNTPTLSDSYLNICVGYLGLDRSKHKFTLVHQADAPGTASRADFTLCYDDGGEAMGYDNWHWVSFPRSEFEDICAGKDTLRVYVKTRTSGYQQLNFRLKDSESQSSLARVN